MQFSPHGNSLSLICFQHSAVLSDAFPASIAAHFGEDVVATSPPPTDAPQCQAGRLPPSSPCGIEEMLGKRSYPLFGTSGKSHFPPGEAYDNKTVNTHSSSKHSFLPQHVTIGFEIPQETKPFDACESPRSVLDANVTSEKHLCGRSFRSCVQALPLRNKGSQGVGLAIIVDIHAEEKAHDCSLPSAGQGLTSLFVHDNLSDQRNSYSLKPQSLNAHYHHRSQPIAIGANCHSQDQSFAYNLSKDPEISRADDEENDDDDLSSLGSMESFGSDYVASWQEYTSHNTTGCMVDNTGNKVRPSIFAVASLPSDRSSYGIQSTSFLEACAFCQGHFAPGKDIFMYRGDQAFCSTECRGERMKIDAYKEKLMTMYS